MVPDQRAEQMAHRYWSLRKRRDALLRTATAVSDGLLLGLLDREALAAVDREFFLRRKEELKGVGHLGYTDDAWNGQGLFAWEEFALKGLCLPGSRVLVTGAGGGREVLALLEKGCNAIGFEPNEDLVEAGDRFLEQRGYPGRLRASPRDAGPSVDGEWDVVVVGWGSYMLMPGRQRRVAFLKEVRELLSPTGHVLISYWPRRWTDERRPRVVALAANVVRRVRRRPPVEVGDLLVPNYVHSFTSAEVEEELSAGGFTLVSSAQRPFGHAVARPRRGVAPGSVVAPT